MIGPTALRAHVMLFWGSRFPGTVKLDTANKLTCVSPSVGITQQKETTFFLFLREKNHVKQGNSSNKNMLMPAHKHEKEENFIVHF